MEPPGQLDRLRALLAEILPRNRFVTRRLGDFGDLRDLADFTARVPFTHKLELVADQAAHPPYGSNLTFPSAAYTRFCQTSGTTGRPLAILDTNESWQWMLDNWQRIYTAAGVEPGARVVDHYGMTEVGPVAFEDPDRPGVLRLIEESYFAEIIEPGGTAPVSEGDVGELVLTPLGRHSWPLLRYRTGDLVKWSRDAHGIALEGGIIGRADDMVVVRGVNVYPAAFDALVRMIPEIGEYRVTVSQRGALAELAVEIESPDDTAAARLERALNQAFSLRIPVTRVPHRKLPRFEMKARRWMKAE